jgi:hypothetical protein
MARITAERLVRHLEQSGYVLMKKPPAVVHSTGSRPQRERRQARDKKTWIAHYPRGARISRRFVLGSVRCFSQRVRW